MDNKMTYKRDKSKVEITGSPNQVNKAMWFDLISCHLQKLLWNISIMVAVGNLWASLPTSTIIPIIISWLSKKRSL
jgi:hypothetical protein